MSCAVFDNKQLHTRLARPVI